MTTGKTIVLTLWTFVSKVMSLLLNMLSGLAMGFPGGLSSKESVRSAGDIGDMRSIPGPGRSPGGGHGNPLQYSDLENPLDRAAWWALIHKVVKSDTTEVPENAWKLGLS